MLLFPSQKDWIGKVYLREINGFPISITKSFRVGRGWQYFPSAWDEVLYFWMRVYDSGGDANKCQVRITLQVI